MDHLTLTTDKLQLVTSAAGTIDVIASYSDFDSAATDPLDAVIPGRQLTKISTATTTDILAAPASNVTRKAKALKIGNSHASVTNTVTLLFNANGTTYEIEKVTLAPGERIALREGVPMRVVTASGIEKTTSTAAWGNATVAQIASHSADTYYLGLPITGRTQAGSWFEWRWRASKGAAGVATPTYIIRVGTAGTTADTARVTVTGAAQTAVADEGYFVVSAGFRAVGASAVLVGQVALWHRLATTGFSVTASNVFATPVASGTFDSTVANLIIGLSVNPGASGAWVSDLVTLDAGNLLY